MTASRISGNRITGTTRRAGGTCGSPSASRSGDLVQRGSCGAPSARRRRSSQRAARHVGVASRPRRRRRRPRASGRSSRGRRRRARADAAAGRRRRCPRRRARARRRRAPRRPPSSRTATLFGLPAAGSPKRRERRARGAPCRSGSAGRRLERDAADLGLERGRRALGDDVPVVDDADAVGEHVGLLEVLRRQEDGHAVLAREPLDLRPQRAAALRVEAGRRLVEEQDGRAVHAARARGRGGASCRPSSRRPCARRRRSARRGRAARRRACGARPCDRPCRPPWRSMCSRPVRKSSSAASCSAAPIVPADAGPSLDDVEPGDRRRPPVGRQQRDEHQHRRRLAGAVGPEEAVDLARRDLEVDAVDGLDPTLELAREPLDADAVVACHQAPVDLGQRPRARGRRTSRVGRIRRPSRFCSRMCADQPATRAQVNMRREQVRRDLGEVEDDRRPELDVRRQHAVGLARLELGQRGLLERLGDLEARRAELAGRCGAAPARAGPRRGRRGGRSPSGARRGRARP